MVHYTHYISTLCHMQIAARGYLHINLFAGDDNREASTLQLIN